MLIIRLHSERDGEHFARSPGDQACGAHVRRPIDRLVDNVRVLLVGSSYHILDDSIFSVMHRLCSSVFKLYCAAIDPLIERESGKAAWREICRNHTIVTNQIQRSTTTVDQGSCTTWTNDEGRNSGCQQEDLQVFFNSLTHTGHKDRTCFSDIGDADYPYPGQAICSV